MADRTEKSGPEGRKSGRPSKLTPRLRDQIVGYVRVGNFASVAARAAGIGESTFYRWMERGERAATDLEELATMTRAQLMRVARERRMKIPARAARADVLELVVASDAPYREFREAIKGAEAQAEAAAVVVIREAMPTSWQAAAWYLERRYPDRYARRERTEVSGPGGGPLRISSLTDEELDDAITRLREVQEQD